MTPYKTILTAIAAATLAIASGFIAAPAQATTTARTSTIQDVSTLFCLDSNTHGNAYTGRCNGGNFQNWTYQGSNTISTIRDVSTGFCLDSNTNGQAYTMRCNGGNFQNWKISNTGGRIMNIATQLCLDSNTAGQLYTGRCNGGNFQNWYHR